MLEAGRYDAFINIAGSILSEPNGFFYQGRDLGEWIGLVSSSVGWKVRLINITSA